MVWMPTVSHSTPRAWRHLVAKGLPVWVTLATTSLSRTSKRLGCTMSMLVIGKMRIIAGCRRSHWWHWSCPKWRRWEAKMWRASLSVVHPWWVPAPGTGEPGEASSGSRTMAIIAIFVSISVVIVENVEITQLYYQYLVVVIT